MKRKDFDTLIDRSSFKELFITEMGWNNPSNSQPIYITIDEVNYDFSPVAEKSGFQVYTCPMEVLPTAAECKKIDNKLRNYGYDYICIFVQQGTLHHLWLTPVKTNEKRELVKTEYIGGAKADFLFSKIDDLSFSLTERVLISDVKARVQGSFHLNSEKVTKDFYVQFRKEHKAFATHITGIADEKERDWYTSVMLNRLMFCYFIQKKGFLDMDTNYLQNKLHMVKQQQGENKFFGTFYKGFLCALFHDGLNNPCHDTEEFLAIYGRIPYLNGGMFDDHQLEREHDGIDIADVAFENLFNFFDKWNWHLDTRLTASGKDINPDVLGYIFEQYINDRAAMGAYYTKEDITEYIGKNCIIPFLMDKTASATQDSAKAFKPEGWIWQSLRQSGDKYIYDAVKKGYSADWQARIPEYISLGINTTGGNLLERRSRWNEKTFEEFALPTEIWRETVERLQRCDSLLQKIQGGEIHNINDFITYNLDIRQFTEDLIRQTQDHKFVAHFYDALQQVTILDPTCGSGAFLFAALNILEPLYEACLDRMEDWHRQNPHLFTEELEEINAKYSSNRQYFIYKSIILRNLYGVDIMVEATEIAKLRLFLKMVAVVDVDKRKDNLGLDPLPDIDFNIKCGNTLVGYATEKQLDEALAYGDMFANAEFKDKINEEMFVVATAYDKFRSEQLKVYDDNASIKATKEMLKVRLAKLNDLLNRHMHQAITAGTNYDAWLKSHQPFHWLAEFYQIIHDNGGFDVIIGNPPYVEYNKVDTKTGKAISDIYKLQNYKTLDCGNLYAYVMERCKSFMNNLSFCGMIVPLSGHSTDRMSSLVKNFYNTFSMRYIYNLSADANPSRLFEGVKFRLCIFIVNNNHRIHSSSKYTRWYAEERENLFKSQLKWNEDQDYSYLSIVGKVASPLYITAISKMQKEKSFFYAFQGTNRCLYHNAPVNWIRSHSFIPYFCSERDGEGITTQLKDVCFDASDKMKLASCILNSSLFFIWWITNSDCYHLNKPEISNFKITLTKELLDKISVLSDKLSVDMQKKSQRRVYNYRTSGRVEYDEFYMKKSKSIIDEIDKVLAKHYGFTEEELDFIINYDIKYRMGDELSGEE